MSFDVLSGGDKGPRLGLLKCAHGTLHTPALLLYTSQGAPVNLNHDTMSSLRSGLALPPGESLCLGFTAADFLESPSPATVKACPKNSTQSTHHSTRHHSRAGA